MPVSGFAIKWEITARNRRMSQCTRRNTLHYRGGRNRLGEKLDRQARPHCPVAIGDGRGSGKFFNGTNKIEGKKLGELPDVGRLSGKKPRIGQI